MLKRSPARSALVVFLCIALALTGCATTAELQKQHNTFGSCFRAEKQNAMLIGAMPGALIGLGAAIRRDNRGIVVGAAIGALGAIIGNRVAWERCLAAFPVKPQTSVVNDRASAIALAQKTPSEAAAKSVTIQEISAGPLVFGKDLEISVTYAYISDNPAKRDVKARVFRNLLFKAPDGSQQEVPSNTEDTIQQGVSRATFAIPTPSLQDAKELQDTKDWAFKYVVEVDGMRQEKIVPLILAQAANADSATAQTPIAAPPPPVAVPAVKSIHLRKGTRLFRDANTSSVVTQLKKTTSVIVLQRTVEGKFNWVKVRLPDGKEGWFREVKK